jgi:hypothetical protein
MQILNNTWHTVIKALHFLVKPIVLFMVCVMMTGMTFVPQSNISREYQIKAVFLYNFCQFVEWPSKAFVHEDDPLIIGILGENPFDSYLEETVKGEKASGHSLEVRHFQQVSQIRECHILFINVTGKDEVKKVISALASRNILTVSEMTNFTKQGGIVRFFTEDNRTRIRINLEAAKKAELIISSKLLKLADIVNAPKN